MNYRERLIKIINSEGPTSLDGLRRLVSLEDFFTGNDDIASIGCNLPDHPSTRFFFQKLLEIRSKAGVDDVLVGITETSEDDPDPTMWPFSDRVYVVSKLPIDQIEPWFTPLRPSSVIVEVQHRRNEMTQAIEQQTAYCFWWD